MRICIDCQQPIKYGDADLSGSLHKTCRGRRGALSARRQADISGKGFGGRASKDPLDVRGAR